jgi:hypothetical protein
MMMTSMNVVHRNLEEYGASEKIQPQDSTTMQQRINKALITSM